jgi:DNA-binding NarL/FixJ family response regulator
MQSALLDLLATLEGFEVVAMVPGETLATEWLQDHPGGWDVATIDLLLDEGSGFNLIHRCKDQPDAGLVVVLSDFVTPVVEQRCRDFGADAVFRKTDANQFAQWLTDLRLASPQLS